MKKNNNSRVQPQPHFVLLVHENFKDAPAGRHRKSERPHVTQLPSLIYFPCEALALVFRISDALLQHDCSLLGTLSQCEDKNGLGSAVDGTFSGFELIPSTCITVANFDFAFI